jgi:hypothetical protein
VTTETSTCPWCSATVPVAASTCPSCGAALRDAVSGDIAGVTQIDPSAVLKTKRIKRTGLAAWLVGERESEEPSIGKVEPPSAAVREEMRRLELAAIEAELDAKTAAAAANRELGIVDNGATIAGAPADVARAADPAPTDTAATESEPDAGTPA